MLQFLEQRHRRYLSMGSCQFKVTPKCLFPAHARILEPAAAQCNSDSSLCSVGAIRDAARDVRIGFQLRSNLEVAIDPLQYLTRHAFARMTVVLLYVVSALTLAIPVASASTRATSPADFARQVDNATVHVEGSYADKDMRIRDGTKLKQRLIDIKSSHQIAGGRTSTTFELRTFVDRNDSASVSVPQL